MLPAVHNLPTMKLGAGTMPAPPRALQVKQDICGEFYQLKDYRLRVLHDDLMRDYKVGEEVWQIGGCRRSSCCPGGMLHSGASALRRPVCPANLQPPRVAEAPNSSLLPITPHFPPHATPSHAHVQAVCCQLDAAFPPAVWHKMVRIPDEKLNVPLGGALDVFKEKLRPRKPLRLGGSNDGASSTSTGDGGGGSSTIFGQQLLSACEKLLIENTGGDRVRLMKELWWAMPLSCTRGALPLASLQPMQLKATAAETRVRLPLHGCLSDSATSPCQPYPRHPHASTCRSLQQKARAASDVARVCTFLLGYLTLASASKVATSTADDLAHHGTTAQAAAERPRLMAAALKMDEALLGGVGQAKSVLLDATSACMGGAGCSRELGPELRSSRCDSLGT